jgi:hypothetical protein
MSGARRQALLLVIVLAIPAAIAAQLNPTVKVLPRAKTAVPAECDQGLAIQPALRLTQEERASVRDTTRDMVAPPSRSLRSELQTAFEAVQHNSRDAFRDALVQAKSMLTSYPPGGERTAAANLVDVLNDVDRIWDYQFTSPTGAFFDTSSEPYRIASKYPGWDAAIRRQIITDQNGVKFYATHETRDFLLAESAQRLSHLTGKPVPPPVSSTRGTTTIARPAPKVTPPATTTTTTTITTTEKTRKPKPHHTTKQTTTETTTRATTHVKQPAQHHAPRQPVVHEARATTTPVRKTPTPPPAPKVQRPAPAPAPSTTTTAHTVPTETASATPTPPPATTSSARTASSDTAVMAPPTSTTSAPSPTETTATTATTESNAAAKPQSRSLFGPILLIIVGIGLLLTLWRASS